MLISFSVGMGGGRQANGAAGGTAAAIFGEVANEIVHRAKVGRVEKLPA
ncbi:MAG TPA: hypothetical protein VIJ78_11270 [Pseudolabrys sp.]